MAFGNFLSSMRRPGRSIVLPVERIKEICKKSLTEKNMVRVLDFGSGTLFWTDWFIEEFKSKVCAVDAYYGSNMIPENDNITYYSDLSVCLNGNSHFSLVWACDVLHHLSPLDMDFFLLNTLERTDIMIIKDIDANHKFGNFINKWHDKIINNETVHNIDPNILMHNLKSFGFKTAYYYLPKFFYPHFMIIGYK